MGIKKQKGPNEAEKINIEKDGNKKQEVVILHETLIQKDERSVWSWLKEFKMEWSETLITKKKKRNLPPP